MVTKTEKLIDTSGYLTIDEAAAYLGLSKRYIYQLNHYDAAPPHRRGKRNRLYYAKTDLDAWVKGRTAGKHARKLARAEKKAATRAKRGSGRRVVREPEQRLRRAA